MLPYQILNTLIYYYFLPGGSSGQSEIVLQDGILLLALPAAPPRRRRLRPPSQQIGVHVVGLGHGPEVRPAVQLTADGHGADPNSQLEAGFLVGVLFQLASRLPDPLLGILDVQTLDAELEGGRLVAYQFSAVFSQRHL